MDSSPHSNADEDMTKEDGESHSVKMESDNEKLDPNTYKTSLCTYYLQGPCRNGEKCHFAHGTSELRLFGGERGVPQTLSVEKKKTTLCVKFVANGSCPYGHKCAYAHSVKEVKAALEAQLKNESSSSDAGHSKNPNYKTALCQNYMSGLYCSFADKCVYAHGKHELREKPASVPPDQLPEEVKKKLIEKAKKMPGYKTRMCHNFETTGICDYDEMCHYAHGQDEIREESSTTVADQKHRNNPFYKSVMCKNKTNCVYAENCVYAHDPSELRTMPSKSSKSFQLTGLGSRIPNQGSESGTRVKTTMCRNIVATGHCSRGSLCYFAHSEYELNRPPQQQQQHSKQTMCRIFADSGFCPWRNQGCLFAHSVEESATAPHVYDSRFKTVLCETWKETGDCQFKSKCRFAHGNLELRTPEANLFSVPTSHPQQQHYQQQPPQQHPQPTGNSSGNYKVALCVFFQKSGSCEKGDSCPFAHGPSELRGNYKTILCKQMSEHGHCSHGDKCHFAHSFDELRTKDNGSNVNIAGSSGMKRKQEFPSFNGGNFSSSSSIQSQPQDQFKSVLCNKFMTFGKCPYGDACTYAHGEAELSQNKRLRI